jgi:RHH-type proline utilization regulon transcriptional repressor/proline dehydrogenase/delta 1-pyrroline-5-carboxylate dehydrogenase
MYAMCDLKNLRNEIASSKLLDEEVLVQRLLDQCEISDDGAEQIEAAACRVVENARTQKDVQPLMDAFFLEYGLSNQEGIALMCLAEALLRVPDKKTRDALIADKIAPGEWAAHIGHADSFFVNASTWGLRLTGQVIALGKAEEGAPDRILGRMIHRLGEPVIRAAMMQAMKVLGAEFVLGETMDEAISRGKKLYGPNQLYSFDMLGEAARTFADADRYFEAYMAAIQAAGEQGAGNSVYDRSGISIKLSALHPSYEYTKREELLRDLLPRVTELASVAAFLGVKLSIDAEEADRLELSLDIFEGVVRSGEVQQDWEGFGLVLQAYGKRALPVISWLDALSRDVGMKFMVRLVKGAYWDSEIKHAQEQGLEDFPVFTRKATSDLSYLVCAQEILKRSDRLFGQFATHNAHTVAAISYLAMGKAGGFEFQRLHGMGRLVYDVAFQGQEVCPPVRVYAPVGGHKDLLAYLVRRLLENGANSSFVNRFMDKSIPPADVVQDPIKVTRGLNEFRHPSIPLPKRIFGMSRDNSMGLDLTSAAVLDELTQAVKDCAGESFDVGPLVPGVRPGQDGGRPVTNPADNTEIIGTVRYATPDEVGAAFDAARKSQPAWDRLGGAKRAVLLNKAADMLEADLIPLIAILVREAGKTYPDAVAEVREAVDFCRYYAGQAEREFTDYVSLPGPAGEENTIGLHGRGVFVCISPWNFPLAIFVGQVVAALAAGNTVLAKSAEQTPIIADRAIRTLHKAGVPEDVAMLLPGDGAVGGELVQHPAVGGVAFTGSTQTAHAINHVLAMKPGPIVPFIAETGGQNVMFVDSTALLEQVTDDVVQSAFKSAGQRCSALRVLYLQEDIADAAIDMIKGAMDTLKIGSPADIDTDVGPVIDRRASDKLGEHCYHMARSCDNHYALELPADCANGTFIAPHLFEIGSITELSEEQFGPILHIVRYAESQLEEKLKEAFSTGYGLTLGIHTRMESRWREVFKKAPVGNTYINRNMVGAVVGSQPFGGQGLSGTGYKAGGPRYLYKFATEKTLSVNIMASGGDPAILMVS